MILLPPGTLTVEQIYQDRDQFAKLVREVAAPDVGRMGIEILSFTIKVRWMGRLQSPTTIWEWGAWQEGTFVPITVPREPWPGGLVIRASSQYARSRA